MLKSYKIIKKWWITWGTLPVFSWAKAAGLYKAGQFKEAQSYYEKGLKKYPNHPASQCARVDLAYCHFIQRQFEQAEKHLRYVISQDPKAREAYLRLAKINIWTGNTLEAAWVYRRAIQAIGYDAELVAGFMLAVLENGGPGYLLKEARRALSSLSATDAQHPKVKLVAAALQLLSGEDEEISINQLISLSVNNSTVETHTILAEHLLARDRITQARRYLRSAMTLSPNNPKVLSLFADSYLKEGVYYNPGYARQLATTAAQNSGWLSPGAMHTLAEAFRHEGDKMSALIMASKARDVGSQRLGVYRGAKHLDALIETLSTGTQA